MSDERLPRGDREGRNVVDDLAEVLPNPTANHRPVIQAPREAEPLAIIVLVVGAAGLQNRRDGDEVRPCLCFEIVAQPEIQRQSLRDLPVVLYPFGRCPPGNLTPEIPYADLVRPNEGVQRIEVPGSHVVPDRNQRLDIGWRDRICGVIDTPARSAIEEEIENVDVLATNPQVVAPELVERGGEVIANRDGSLTK